MNFYFPCLLRRHLWLALCAALVGSPAQAWFGPSEQDPYLLSNATAPAMGWHWADARVGLQTANVATRDGYSLGDAVFKPRPFDYLQAEFARQVQAHPAQASLQKRLNGQTLRLLESEVSVGLWMPRWPVQIPPPVATPNSPRQDRADYDDSGLTAMRAAASFSR